MKTQTKDTTSSNQSVKPAEVCESLHFMLCFGVHLVKDFHLSALESLKPKENKMKARKMFIPPLLFTGPFLYFL
jgi:hypothetical protein